MTQSEAILAYLRAQFPTWKFSHELSQRWLEWRDSAGDQHREWVGSEGKKRSRELVLEGKIERERDGRYEKFRAIPPKRIEVYRDAVTGEVLRKVPVYG